MVRETAKIISSGMKKFKTSPQIRAAGCCFKLFNSLCLMPRAELNNNSDIMIKGTDSFSELFSVSIIPKWILLIKIPGPGKKAPAA
jgi:hypothetical protein